MRNSRQMGNMVANVYVKSNYDRLSIDKALGNWKFDNNNENNAWVSITAK